MAKWILFVLRIGSQYRGIIFMTIGKQGSLYYFNYVVANKWLVIFGW
jgi:hypothetical protein